MRGMDNITRVTHTLIPLLHIYHLLQPSSCRVPNKLMHGQGIYELMRQIYGGQVLRHLLQLMMPSDRGVADGTGPCLYSAGRHPMGLRHLWEGEGGLRTPWWDCGGYLKGHFQSKSPR